MTSQIFANVYLNEFDRYVRHHLKPLGYARYGDDFVLFMDNKTKAYTAQSRAIVWLADNLQLQVHPKDNIVIAARRGLHFLGHRIYPAAPLSVDKATVRKINQKVDQSNVASYKVMHLPAKYIKQIPWLLTDSPEKYSNS